MAEGIHEFSGSFSALVAYLPPNQTGLEPNQCYITFWPRLDFYKKRVFLSLFFSFLGKSVYDKNIRIIMKKRYYIIGIGGIAMASLAGLLKKRGYEVSGSDQEMYEPTKT